MVGKEAFWIWPLLQRPYGRGKVLLKSLDPEKPPKIITNFLKDQRDVDILIDGKWVYMTKVSV